MAERTVNCFKCGVDGHMARACPQCITALIQPTTPVITADNPDTSPETVLKREKTAATTTTEVADLTPSATAVEATGTWPEPALQV